MDIEEEDEQEKKVTKMAEASKVAQKVCGKKKKGRAKKIKRVKKL